MPCLDQNIFMLFLPYANFISANFITATFQNFQKIFGLCVLGLFISLLQSLCLANAILELFNLANVIFCPIHFIIVINLPNAIYATFSRSKKSHKARTLCTI